MNIKKQIIRSLITIIAAIVVASCENECVSVEKAHCDDIPPTNELCLAYFERWFYDQNSKSCKKISYSGCSPYGFETQEECEECTCN